MNKLNGEVRGMLRQALEDEGGVDYLRRVAREHPQAFLAALTKLIPAEVALSAPNGPLIEIYDYTGQRPGVRFESPSQTASELPERVIDVTPEPEPEKRERFVL